MSRGRTFASRLLLSTACSGASGAAIAAAEAAAAPEEVRYVGSGLVTVQQQPAQSSKVVARLPINTPVRVGNRSGAWCEVTSAKTKYADEARGYVGCARLRSSATSAAEIKTELDRTGAEQPYELDTFLPDRTFTSLPPAAIRARLEATARSFFFAPNETDFVQYGQLLELEWLNRKKPQEGAIDGRPQKVPRDPVFDVMKAYMRNGLVGKPRREPGLSRERYILVDPKETSLDGYRFAVPRIGQSLFRSTAEIAGMVGQPFAVRQRDRLKKSDAIRWAGQDTDFAVFVRDAYGSNLQWLFGPRYVSRHSGVIGIWDVAETGFRFSDVSGWALSATGIVKAELLEERMRSSDSCGSPAQTLFRVEKPIQKPLAFIVTPHPIDPANVSVTRLPRGGKGEKGGMVFFAAAVDLDADRIPDLLIVHTQGDEPGDVIRAGPPIVKGFQVGARLYANVAGKWQAIHLVSEDFCT